MSPLHRKAGGVMSSQRTRLRLLLPPSNRWLGILPLQRASCREPCAKRTPVERVTMSTVCMSGCKETQYTRMHLGLTRSLLEEYDRYDCTTPTSIPALCPC